MDSIGVKGLKVLIFYTICSDTILSQQLHSVTTPKLKRERGSEWTLFEAILLEMTVLTEKRELVFSHYIMLNLYCSWTFECDWCMKIWVTA